MKKIGFIDYFLDEWHANNYPAWIKEVCDAQGIDMRLAYAWAEKDVPPYEGKTTDEWCAAYGVSKCATIDELCRCSDYIFILAPSNPEKHLEYAKTVLQYGKNTYIDKSFAPDLKTARAIYVIADYFGAKIFSSSALRYATELNFSNVNSITTFGGGGNFDEYIIHQTEMVVKTLKSEAYSVCVDKQDGEYICKVKCKGGKQAIMLYSEFLPFAVNLFCKDGSSSYRLIGSDYFKLLIVDILRFFESGEPSFDKEETLEVMKIREAVIKGKNQPGKIITF